MSVKEVGTFYLPTDVVEKSQGFSFDVGGSVAKVVYRCKKEDTENQHLGSKFTKLQLASVGMNEIDAIVKIIKEESVLPKSKDGKCPTIYVTGVGAKQFKKELEDGLNMKLELVDEFACNIKAFTYACKTLPKHLVVVPKSRFHDVAMNAVKTACDIALTFKEAYEAGKVASKQVSFDEIEMAEKIKKQFEAQEKDDIPYAVKENVFPCVLSTHGSAHAFLQINEDGSSWLVDIGNYGGKSFLGQGRIWTGAKTYEEIMELARRGDNHNVDTYLNDLIDPANNADDFYSKLSKQNDEFLSFCFGKAASTDKEILKKEDMAKSLLVSHCLEIARSAVFNCLVTQSDKVFLTGSFVEDPLTRDLITHYIIRKHYFAAMNCRKNEEPIDFNFIQGGSHLGAIGALLKSAGI